MQVMQIFTSPYIFSKENHTCKDQELQLSTTKVHKYDLETTLAINRSEK